MATIAAFYTIILYEHNRPQFINTIKRDFVSVDAKIVTETNYSHSATSFKSQSSTERSHKMHVLYLSIFPTRDLYFGFYIVRSRDNVFVIKKSV